MLSLKRALQIHVDHRVDVITRRTEHLLSRGARACAHLGGSADRAQFLDEVIRTIRTADSADDAKGKLIARFGLSDKQTQAILDMQLRRLAALERQKIEDEYNALPGQISFYEALLADTARILGVIKTEVLDLKAKFGDERRTEIVPEAAGDFSEEDLIRQEAVLISVTQGSYVKRTPQAAYRAQRRGAGASRGCAPKTRTRWWISSRPTRSTICSSSPTVAGCMASAVFALPETARTTAVACRWLIS